MAKSIRKRFHNDRNRQAFNHWRDHAINQMTAASSTMFGLAGAGLAYSLTLLSAEKRLINGNNLSTFRFFTVAFAVSFVVALLLIFNRLWGFRKTAEIVRARDAKEASGQIGLTDMDDIREESGFIDALTWALFYIQFGSFVIGGCGLIFFMWQLYGV